MIKEMIYDIEQTSIESELAVVESMMAAYDKMDLIMENTDTQIMDCGIFQEGKIMDDVKEQGVGQSKFQRFLTFIPRLIKALFNAITRLFDTKSDTKTSSKKDNTKVKDVKNPKDTKKNDDSSDTNKKSLPEAIKEKINKILKSDKPKKEKKNALADALLTAADTSGALLLGTAAVGTAAFVGVGAFAAKGAAGAIVKGKQNRDSGKARKEAQEAIDKLAEEIIDTHDKRMQELNTKYLDVKKKLSSMGFTVPTKISYFVDQSTGKRIIQFNIYNYAIELEGYLDNLAKFLYNFIVHPAAGNRNTVSSDISKLINDFLAVIGLNLEKPLDSPNLTSFSENFKKCNEAISKHIDDITFIITKRSKDFNALIGSAHNTLLKDLSDFLNKTLPCAIMSLNELITIQEKVEKLDTSLFGDARSSGFIMNSFSAMNKGARVNDMSKYNHKKIEDTLTKSKPAPKPKPAPGPTPGP